MLDLRAVLLVCLLLWAGIAWASPVYDPMMKVLSEYGENLNQQQQQPSSQPGGVVEKRRWLFPTQKSMSPLYPTSGSDCTEDLGQMINQFRRMPRGKDRDAMIAAIYSYCANKNV
ncbi:hypothetical protein BV898_01580 [Hypsibius exemplaris]|uniref:Uncharacterized protein n=1 Tax=Hypsibius exemplaris TaxID=2072580 RepID=A0A1W0XAU6_HYPEX|nr:hypothetical protein BV898_01580 [Hypsibius exemplaris]